MNKRILDAFARGIAPSERLPLKEWAARHVRLEQSSRSKTADLSITPWLIDPLESFFDNSNSEVVLCFPPGSGKSTLFEIAAAYIVAQRPGPALFTVLADSDAKEWADVRLRPVLEACEPIKPLWPQDRHKNTKGLISFPHMPLWVSGANVGAYQGKSCDYVFCDEGWQIKKSLLKEARARTHDRLFAKFILASQAGDESDDFTEAFRACRAHEFCFLCPSCGVRQPWKWERLTWDTERDDAGAISWEAIKPVYSCECGHQWQDTPNDRRAMSDSGQYVARPGNAKPGHVAYTFNALAVWWTPWAKLASEFLAANEAKKRGDIAPLRQWQQKRLSKFWTDEEWLDTTPVNTNEYKLGERAGLDRIILTVDVQQHHFYYAVREWGKSGESRLLDYGRLLTFSDIERKQQEWAIDPRAVFIDSAYRGEEVKAALCRYGWIGLNGRGDRDFPVTRSGKKARAIYSMPNTITAGGRNGFNFYYSSGGAKDILFVLKAGNGSRWEVASDAPADYLEALNSEVKKDTGNGLSYVQIRTNNHALDLEAMQIIGAMIHRCYPVVLMEDD